MHVCVFVRMSCACRLTVLSSHTFTSMSCIIGLIPIYLVLFMSGKLQLHKRSVYINRRQVKTQSRERISNL